MHSRESFAWREEPRPEQEDTRRALERRLQSQGKTIQAIAERNPLLAQAVLESMERILKEVLVRVSDVDEKDVEVKRLSPKVTSAFIDKLREVKVDLPNT